MAVTWSDLNLRAGPGPAYPILSVIPANQVVAVQGCLEITDWCSVSYDGVDGWASGSCMTGEKGTAVHVDRTAYSVKTVTYDNKKDEAALAVGSVGAIIGAVVAGPIGAIVGGAIGAGTGSALAPDSKVTTYAMTNPTDTIYLDGEVVVGAGIPETITLAEVPDSEYFHAHINGVPVLVERKTRRIVHNVRRARQPAKSAA